MEANWPSPQNIELADIGIPWIQIRAGVILDRSQWSSTEVTGSVGGGGTNGNTWVSGSITSNVTQHNRVFVKFPDDDTEFPFNCDDWGLDLRPGHRIVIAFGPSRNPGRELAFAAAVVDTRQSGPQSDWLAGTLVAGFMDASGGILTIAQIIRVIFMITATLVGISFTAAGMSQDRGAWIGGVLVTGFGGYFVWLFASWLVDVAKARHMKSLGRRAKARVLPLLDQYCAQVPKVT